MNQTLRRYLYAAFRRVISRRSTFRGSFDPADGRITLLTVDFHITDDAIRLIRSFRKFVDPQGPVVVVQNGDRSDSKRLREIPGVKVVNFGINLGHGLGLDLGMRSVRTQYTLICDPDAAIISHKFKDEVLPRVQKIGAASVDNGCFFYHPICLCFETKHWKNNPISMEHQWYRPPGWDVAGALTYEVLGGLKDEALIPRTRSAGPPLPSSREGTVHYYGDVFGDVFSNTYCASRKILEADRQDFEGWSRQELDAYHAAWRAWVAKIVEGSATVEDFPTGPAEKLAKVG